MIDDVNQDQPPHFQAKKRYERVLAEKLGRFIVTMEHPNHIALKRVDDEITPGARVLLPPRPSRRRRASAER